MMFINESVTDTVVVYLILKKLIAPWEKWDAFKVGIIDNLGNKLKKPSSSEERNAWSMLDRFVYRLKWILQKFVGRSKLASLFTAALLLKDHYLTVIKADSLLLKEAQMEMKNFNHADDLAFYRLAKDSPIWHLRENQIFLISEKSESDLLFMINKYQKGMVDYLNEEKTGILEECLKK